MLSNKFMVQLSVLFAATIMSTTTYADHSWGKYKWKPTSIPFNLDLGDNLNSTWDGHLLSASTDWSVSTVLDTNVTLGSTTSDPVSCNPTLGNVQVCNTEYGNNGWLGIAQIYTRGPSIIAAVAKFNDTYFNTANYNTAAWRQLVMCQEVGHTFGLGHQDEAFDNVNLGTCMDYTDDPDGSIDGEMTNEHPNQHDYDQLEIIYGGGSDGGDGKSCNPKSPKCNPALAAGSHAQFGQLVSARGGVSVYVKNLGNGNKLHTHVTWTLEHVN